jgi:predicted transcriptional regulator
MAKRLARHPALTLFRLFGEPRRVVIFQRLTRQPSTASELARELPISRTAIVQHLTLLKAHGLVDATTEGRERVYRTCPRALAPLKTWLDGYG